jgi:hypothetical protein
MIPAAFVLLICGAGAYGQGGWRQWNVYLRDGTSIMASPLALNETGELTYSMRNVPIERSKISYIAIVADNLPALPAGISSRDVVVKTNGSLSVGAVRFLEVKFSEGKIRQNGKTIDLKDVAYIKFAQPKKPSKQSP